MYAVEFGSTGAAWMSRFHQLVAGNTGSGTPGGAPCTGVPTGQAAKAGPARPASASNRQANRDVRIAGFRPRREPIVGAGGGGVNAG